MELQYLHEFIILAQTENYLEAADQLFVAQSSLSRHIMGLEKELGVSLFDRSTRKVQLTAYGQLFLPYARQIVGLRDQFVEKLEALHREANEHFIIGTIPALIPYGISGAVLRFQKLYPDIDLTIHQAGSGELKEMLLNGKCELAFIREAEPLEPGRDEFTRIPFDVDRIVAIFPLDHALASRVGSISLTELQDEDFYLLEKHTMLYNLCYDAFKKQGIEPRIVYTDHNVPQIIDFIEQGAGVALLMEKVAQHLYRNNYAVLPLEPPVSTSINLCCRKGGHLSSNARLFLDCAKEFSAFRRTAGL